MESFNGLAAEHSDIKPQTSQHDAAQGRELFADYGDADEEDSSFQQGSAVPNEFSISPLPNQTDRNHQVDVQLIGLIQRFSTIYNGNTTTPQGREERQAAWNAVSQAMGMDVTWCERRYRTLKAAYYNWRSGAANRKTGSVVQPTVERLSLYARMSFLDEHYKPRQIVPGANPVVMPIGGMVSAIANGRPLPGADGSPTIAPPLSLTAGSSAIALPSLTTRSEDSASDYDGVDDSLSSIDQQFFKSHGIAATAAPQMQHNSRKRKHELESVLEDEYELEGRALAAAVRKLPRQDLRDFAVLRLRCVLYDIQRGVLHPS